MSSRCGQYHSFVFSHYNCNCIPQFKVQVESAAVLLSVECTDQRVLAVRVLDQPSSPALHPLEFPVPVMVSRRLLRLVISRTPLASTEHGMAWLTRCRTPRQAQWTTPKSRSASRVSPPPPPPTSLSPSLPPQSTLLAGPEDTAPGQASHP